MDFIEFGQASIHGSAQGVGQVLHLGCRLLGGLDLGLDREDRNFPAHLYLQRAGMDGGKSIALTANL